MNKNKMIGMMVWTVLTGLTVGLWFAVAQETTYTTAQTLTSTPAKIKIAEDSPIKYDIIAKVWTFDVFGIDNRGNIVGMASNGSWVNRLTMTATQAQVEAAYAGAAGATMHAKLLNALISTAKVAMPAQQVGP